MFWIWAILVLLFALGLWLDLGFPKVKGRPFTQTSAMIWSCIWIVAGLAFNGWVYCLYEFGWLEDSLVLAHHFTGRQAAVRFFTGFLVEKAICVGVVFLMALIFAHFRIHLAGQERVLFWGILGIVGMCAVTVPTGVNLMRSADWVVYAFAGALFYLAAEILSARTNIRKPRRNVLLRLVRRFLPDSRVPAEGRFVVRTGGRREGTTLLAAMILVLTVGIFHAVGAVPAVMAATRESFLMVTSTALALLGLHSLYFLVAGFMNRFRFIKISVALVLGLAGAKFLLEPYAPLPIPILLAVMVALLAVGLAASILHTDSSPLLSPLAEDMEKFGAVSLKQARRVVVLILGTSLVFLGMVFLLTPMPGLLTILAGLAVIGSEFIWARRWLRTVRRQARLWKESVFRK